MADWARPVVFFEIRGRDKQRLKEFYAAIFNWKIDENEAINYAVIEHGIGGPPDGVGGGIGQSDEPRVLVYVQVLSPDETLRKVGELGGKTVLAPVDIPGGPTIAQFQDPEGNLIGLVKQ